MISEDNHWIILVALGPLAVGLILYTSWMTTGSVPFGLDTLTFPTIVLPALPALPELSLPLPPFVGELQQRIVRNGPAMWAALAAGAIVGMMVVGTLADMVRVLLRLVSRPETPLDEA